MGLRFRKTVKIAPGVKVNLSGSGVSLTVGPRGFTHTIGKRGIYRNISLPGTGIYSREKVADLPGTKAKGGSGGSGSGSGRGTKRLESVGTSVSREGSVPAAVREWRAYTGESDPRFAIDISPEGTITLLDAAGQPITDPQLISIIKRTPQYKEQLPVARERHRLEVAEQVEELNARDDALVQIHRYAPAVLDRASFEGAMANLAPELPEPDPYPVAPPTEESVRRQLLSEDARGGHAADGPLESRIADRLDLETQLWELARDEHDRAERERISQLGAAGQQDLDELRASYRLTLDGDPTYIEAVAEAWIAGIELPVERDAQFEYREQDARLMVDLDLPEIEDLPSTVATQLANGDLRIKDKSQRQLRQDYARCVFGLVVYMAANLLNISPAVREVVVSGYTQRRDGQGDLVDEYILSVRFPREALYGVDYDELDPEAFCLDLESRCNVTTTKLFKAIEPYA